MRSARNHLRWLAGGNGIPSRRLARTLADEGRTVYVSSHLMSEMALMADHLCIIGRGRVLADSSMGQFIADHAASYVRVYTPQQPEVASLLRQAGAGLVVHELTPVRSSLEDAFMTLTADSVEHHAQDARAA